MGIWRISSIFFATFLNLNTGNVSAQISKYEKWQDGEIGHSLGCLANQIWQPELGACMHIRSNRDAYDRARREIQERGGGGVLLPPENPLDFGFDTKAEFLPPDDPRWNQKENSFRQDRLSGIRQRGPSSNIPQSRCSGSVCQ